MSTGFSPPFNTPGKVIRASHLFRSDGRTLIVAMDHGMMGITKGIEVIADTIEKVIKGGADGVLINFGIARKLADRLAGRIGIVLSIPFDVKYVELAVKIGADAVKTTYFGPVPPSEERMKQISEIAQATDDWQIPYMAEVVPTDEKGKVVYDLEQAVKAARVGAELGGDIVKTEYVGPVEKYREVTRSCPVPIVVMGGAKMGSPLDVLKMTWEAVKAGAAGGTIGRNIWQHKNPEKMTEALVKIIHENLSVEEAAKIIQ